MEEDSQRGEDGRFGSKAILVIGAVAVLTVTGLGVGGRVTPMNLPGSAIILSSRWLYLMIGVNLSVSLVALLLASRGRKRSVALEAVTVQPAHSDLADAGELVEAGSGGSVRSAEVLDEEKRIIDWPPDVGDGIYGDTYISIDERSVLRVRSMIVDFTTLESES